MASDSKQPILLNAGAETTQWLFSATGIKPGMRVLDVGSGPGDLTVQTAQLLGPEGEVVGLEINPTFIKMAQDKIASLGLKNARFVQDDLNNIASTQAQCGLFDAIIGRRVLMYLADPAKSLRQLATMLKPGGVVAFQEHDFTVLTPDDRLVLHHKVLHWAADTIAKEGGNIHIGRDLRTIAVGAGLQVEAFRCEATVQTPELHKPLGPIFKVIMPRIVAQGVATEQEIDPSTIDQRLIEERKAYNSTYIGELIYGVLARKGPDASATGTV